MTVLVVGGGITGLATAHALGAAGVPTLLVEGSDRLGGKVRTDRTEGFLVESGPDSFISYRPAGLELCRELGLAEAVIRPVEPRTVTVRIGERFVRLPDGMGLVLPTRMRPFVTSRMFSPLEKARMGLDLVLPRRLDGTDVAVGPFLRGRLGGALVERLAGPLIGGVYGTPIDELSLDAVVPQLREAERDHRSLLLASLAQGRARRRSGAPAGSPFVSLAGGLGQLTDALVATLWDSPQVALRTGTSVVGLERSGGHLAAILAGAERLEVDGVVLASPAAVSADLVEDLAPDAATHIRSIPHGSTGVVTVAYRADQLPGPLVGHGFLVAEGEPLAISACTWSSNKWPDRAPEGHVLLRAFIGSPGERLLGRPDRRRAGGRPAGPRGDDGRPRGNRSSPACRASASRCPTTRSATWGGSRPPTTPSLQCRAWFWPAPPSGASASPTASPGAAAPPGPSRPTSAAARPGRRPRRGRGSPRAPAAAAMVALPTAEPRHRSTPCPWAPPARSPSWRAPIATSSPPRVSAPASGSAWRPRRPSADRW